MQEMKYFNEGNDCDICKNQLMTGRDGTVEDCRRRQNGLSCRFEERDIRTCPVCEHEVDREDMYFTTGAGYTNTGLTPSGTSGGYCSRMEMASDIGRIPTVASGSETTYECDGLWFNNTIVAVALFGGSRGNGSRCGLSYWNVSSPATNVATSFVASLSCKPPVAAA